MKAKITKRLVDDTTATDKPVVVADSEMPGFVLKVTPAGGRSYQLRYRMGGRDTPYKTFTLGQHGVLTAEQARRMAQMLLGDVKRGIDPAVEKKRKIAEDKGAVTIERLSRDFLDIHAKPHLKPRSYVEYERAFRAYIIPRVGKIKVRDLTHGDVRGLHHSMRTMAITANRTIQVLSKFMSWAIVADYRPDRQNPCKGLQKYDEPARQRYLSPVEIEAVGAAIRDLEADATLSPWQAALFRCLLLTGMRSSELRLLQWEWVDFDAALFRLPDTKTGARDIPIPSPVLQILNTLPRVADCPFVFAGRTHGKPLANTRWPWSQIVVKSGIKAARPHDLRHSAASIGVSAGASLLLIGGVLGHRSQATTSRYSHLSADPVRQTSEMIEKWSRFFGQHFRFGKWNACRG